LSACKLTTLEAIMAITPRTTINPQNMAARWQSGVAAGGARWLAGLKSPRRMPDANPTQRAANWQAGVATAVAKFEKNTTGPTFLTRLENGATAKQGSYTGAGTAHQADFLASAGKLATAIETAVGALPPKGPRGTNTGRSTAFQEAMHAKRGQLGK
jgi:hypothetical protein